MNFQLAEINIGKLLAPIDSPLLADFVADLDRINKLAENSPGFIWRLKDDNGNATHFNPYNDASIIINMSVWEDAEALKRYVYQSDHVEVFKKRAKWFEKMTTPYMAMWWIEAGKFPTAEEGKNRIEYLGQHGESLHAFTYRKLFDKPLNVGV